jgi:hypothetical protein
MPTTDQAAVRPLETDHDFDEARLEAIGFVFHGLVPTEGAKRPAAKAGTNLLHFARCGKLERVGAGEVKIWFRSIRVAKQHLDEAVGANRWKWCKICEREVTQKVLNEH